METLGMLIGLLLLIYLAKRLPLLRWTLIVIGVAWLFGL